MKEVGLETYFKEINRIQLLTAKEEKELAIRVRRGDAEAREQMIKANLRLVVSIAKNYVDRGLMLLDLIEEGNLGLLKAVERFDPDEECRFSTYATWWIKQSIKRALIDTVKTIRIPSYMVELLSKWKSMASNLNIRLGRAPTFEEISEALEIPPESAGIIKTALRASNSSSQTISLENMWTLSEVLEDKDAKEPVEILFDEAEVELIESLLASIDDRDARILRLRYGLDSGDPMTLKEIGEKVNLSRERVRQIENDALKKLYCILTQQVVEPQPAPSVEIAGGSRLDLEAFPDLDDGPDEALRSRLRPGDAAREGFHGGLRPALDREEEREAEAETEAEPQL